MPFSVRCRHVFGTAALASGVFALAWAADSPVDFNKDVKPVLARCLGCHGPGMQMAGLRLDERDAVLKVLKPGDAEHSRMIEVVSGKGPLIMPPAGPRLTPEQVATLRRWIDEGARWGAAAPAAKPTETAPEPGHWAFRRIRRPDVPSVSNAAWPVNDIDRFILTHLEAEGIAPSPPAGKAALLRRVSLDLTGLPPTPAETDAFEQDNRPDAYERAVDRLLASPHYGEHQARHWLDVAHYADSDGYEKDRVRPWAWRWRNWVIDAFNRDLPFDRFTMAQIAGDQMPGATTEDRVATGFLRQTLTNREAGVLRAEDRYAQLIDRTGTVGTAWLGLTVRCAQCHNHKYDPISHRDYYSLFALFDRAREADIDAPLPGEAGPYLRARAAYLEQREKILRDAGIAEKQAAWEDAIRAAMANPGAQADWDFNVTELRAGLDHADRLLQKPVEKRTVREQAAVTGYFLRSPGPVIGKNESEAAVVKQARTCLEQLDSATPTLSQAMAIEEDPEPRRTFTRPKGDYRAEGVEVQPGTPEFLPPMPANLPRTRLGLAQWLFVNENPLTARVAANRIWQQFFGQGLVSTPDDFGTQGAKPTHPELLDWLATEYRRVGWSTKAMIRTVVLSATYRQSSKARKDLESRDPANTLLARQSALRLPAETVRDAALAVSGLLDPAIGGRSVRPPQPAGVAELGYAGSVKWVDSEGTARYRRGLYIHFQRTTPYPFLMNFDAPDSVMACMRRRSSNTPLQALNLLNDPVFDEAAEALAWRLERESPAEKRLDHAFRLAVGRAPSPAERTRIEAYLRSQPSDSAWHGVSRVLLNLHEFITRE